MSLSVLITGAAGGIGYALSIEYAKISQTLILCDFNKEKLSHTAEICSKFCPDIKTLCFDLSSPKEIEDAIKSLPKNTSLNRLILVGGVSQRGAAIKTDISVDRKIMEINYFGHIYLTKLLLNKLIENKKPAIGVISSISGRFGFHLRSAYAASKFALHGFYESLRLEHTKDNLSVSIICPGRINTPISLSAITENGNTHGKMDPGQETGMSAEICAVKIRKAIEKRKKDVLIGNKELLMVYFKKYLPFVFYKLANKINPK